MHPKLVEPALDILRQRIGFDDYDLVEGKRCNTCQTLDMDASIDVLIKKYGTIATKDKHKLKISTCDVKFVQWKEATYQNWHEGQFGTAAFSYNMLYCGRADYAMWVYSGVRNDIAGWLILNWQSVKKITDKHWEYVDRSKKDGYAIRIGCTIPRYPHIFLTTILTKMWRTIIACDLRNFESFKSFNNIPKNKLTK